MSRPNILLITSDQHRGDTLGCAGHPCVRTPRLDQLAYEGLRCENAFSDCPICIPARTTLITGIKSSTYGAPGYHADFRIDRDRNKFLGSLLTVAGYQTGLVGKRHWHCGHNFKGGFETVIPIERCKKAQDLHTRRPGLTHGLGANELHPGLSTLPPELYSTDWTTDRSLEWLQERETDRPFFLWASYVDPHPPFAIHEPFYSMYDQSPIPEPVIGEWCDSDRCPAEQLEHRVMYNPGPMGADELRKARAVYYGMITNLDHQLGRIFGYLMQQGLWEETLVIYTSDHGEHLGDHYDFAKSSFYNSAGNVPFIVRPPRSWGWTPGLVNGSPVELADILPTLCAATNAVVPDDVEGVDLRPLGEGRDAVRTHLFGQIDGRHLVHDGEWKYIYHTMDGIEQLFAVDDRNDRFDVSERNRSVCDRLRRTLLTRLQSVDHPDSVDGQLRNAGRQARSPDVLRTVNPKGWVVAGRNLGFSRPV